jgi:hypothetical protein
LKQEGTGIYEGNGLAIRNEGIGGADKRPDTIGRDDIRPDGIGII